MGVPYPFRVELWFGNGQRLPEWVRQRAMTSQAEKGAVWHFRHRCEIDPVLDVAPIASTMSATGVSLSGRGKVRRVRVWRGGAASPAERLGRAPGRFARLIGGDGCRLEGWTDWWKLYQGSSASLIASKMDGRWVVLLANGELVRLAATWASEATWEEKQSIDGEEFELCQSDTSSDERLRVDSLPCASVGATPALGVRFLTRRGLVPPPLACERETDGESRYTARRNSAPRSSLAVGVTGETGEGREGEGKREGWVVGDTGSILPCLLFSCFFGGFLMCALCACGYAIAANKLPSCRATRLKICEASEYGDKSSAKTGQRDKRKDDEGQKRRSVRVLSSQSSETETLAPPLLSQSPQA